MAKKKKKPAAPPPPPKPPAAPPKRWFCHFPTPDADLPPKFVSAVADLEKELGLPIWMMVQAGDSKWDELSEMTVRAFRAARNMGLARGQKVALLIDSCGGQARSAYEIATLLRKHCGGFVAVIPRLAKSAATLLALGSDDIILGEYGELGPLDVQIDDPERQEQLSGLDEVHSLERLNAFAMTAIDKAMLLFLNRMGMKAKSLLPHVTRFVADFTGPLFGHIDVVHYTQVSRALKVGEEYARRLLRRRIGKDLADEIARKLVENYQEHGFIIDYEEATELHLQPKKRSADLLRIMDEVSDTLDGVTAIGRITERP